jgi:hypothetical protein
VSSVSTAEAWPSIVWTAFTFGVSADRQRGRGVAKIVRSDGREGLHLLRESLNVDDHAGCGKSHLLIALGTGATAAGLG